MTEIISINRGNSTFDLRNGIIKTKITTTHFANKQVALVHMSIPYSWKNISSALNNRTFQYVFNGNTRNVVLPETTMSIAAMEEYLEFVMFENGDYLLDATGRPVYYIQFRVNPINYSITFTFTVLPTALPTDYTNPASWTFPTDGLTPQIITDGSDFNLLLGLNKNDTFPADNSATTDYDSPNVPDIKSISTINIACNLMSNQIQLNSFIYTFSPDSEAYGEYVIRTPAYPLFFDMLPVNLDTLEFRLIDQKNRNVAIVDSDITLTLLVKPSEKV